MSTSAPPLPADGVHVGSPTSPSTGRTLLRRWWRGRADDPAWVRPALVVVLVLTAVLYLWDLGASGWANAFYSAAAQAGSQSWKALFFGASDAAGAITVDKTPLSLWVMALSVRLFGLSAWSLLVPQALMGVATVGLVFATVRRAFSPAAALLAAVVVATTPVAVLMFRFNNPDALLVLLLTAATYATLRAVEAASTRWLVLGGALVGLGFMTKMLQALLVVPALALAYVVSAPTPLRRRVIQLLAAAAALVVTGGLWVAVVELVPASARPYIGGSQHNSVLELALGYNGLGRLDGNETGSVGGNNGWGATGLTRLLTGENGGQAGWLLPAALALLVVGLVLTWRTPRIHRQRAHFVAWGTSLVVTALVFSLMQGIFHVYYTIALAPMVGALVGMGAELLWRRRSQPLWTAVLATVVGLTAVWSWVLLGRAAGWHPWLRWAVLLLGLLAVAGLFVDAWLPRSGRLAVVGAALAAVLLGPLGWSLNTAATAHTGSIVTAGPRVANAAGFGPRGGFPGRGGGPAGMPGGMAGGTRAGMPGGAPAAAPGGTAGGAPRAGGMGGLLDASAPSAAVVAALRQDASSYDWAAAAVGSQTAAGLQLASQAPVMSVGGFNGSDPSPTLAQFQQYVAEGRIHWFVAGRGGQGGQGGPGGGPGGAMGGSGAAQQIATWVAQTYTARTVDGVTLYDLSSGAKT
ncbi:MAG: glycosyltransferase family 39 protein [Angustibacter sp.]